MNASEEGTKSDYFIRKLSIIASTKALGKNIGGKI